MRRFFSRYLSPSMIVALLALLVSLGGVSYAATTLPRNSVGSAQIRTGAVGSSELATNAVTSAKVRNHTLLRADFKSGQIPSGPAGPAGPPGLSGLVAASATAGPGTGSHTAVATCPSGKRAISGGWQDAAVAAASQESITQARIQDDGTSFRVDGKLSDGSDSWSLTAYVLCATVAA